MFIARRSGRIVALVLALGLVAAACSDGDDESSTAAPGNEVEADGSTDSDQADDDADGSEGSDSGDSGGDDDESTTELENFELFTSTETARPWDLDGGAVSSDEGVTIVDDNPTFILQPQIREATNPWPTDWSRQTVALDELLIGISRIDPRDSIPPIDRPMFEPIAAATWLEDREPGALVQFNDEVRFYPLSILTRHEIVNDRFGDIPVAVSFCPLCNTAVSFDRRVDGQVLRFGVSGLLRNSDLVMWDDATTSLWQQVTGEGIVGDFAGTQLEIIPTSIVSYSDALESFPDALSLSSETGFGIPYGANPYASYSSLAQPFLFDGEPDPRFPALSRVVGVTIDESDKGYPFETIRETRAVNDEVGGVPIAVWWGGDTADALDASNIADGQSIGTGIAFDRRVDDQVLTFAPAEDADRFVDEETGTTWTLLGLAVDGPLEGSQLETVSHRNEFWFAWAAFFPEAELYENG